MPKTPHSSLNLSSMSGHSSRQSTRSIAVDQTRSASSTRRSITSATGDRDPQAGCRRSRRSRAPARPPPRRAAAPSSRCPATTDTTTRDADSPNSAAASFDAAIASRPARPRSTLRRRRRRCRSSTRPASPPARRPSSRAPSAPGARRPASTSSACSARSGVEIERRRHAAHQIVQRLQILAAAKFAATFAEQHDRRRPNPGIAARRRGRRARAGRRRR